MLGKHGDEFLITIDNQLLKESREEGLLLRKERFMATASGRLCRFTAPPRPSGSYPSPWNGWVSSCFLPGV